MDKSLADLRAKIVDAFSSVPHPGEENITGHRCEECDELREIFAPLQSNEIPFEIIDNNSDQLPLFTPEAYRYFLPSYLLRCLENFDSEDTVCELVIYSLTSSPSEEEDMQWVNEQLKRWFAQRQSLFDSRQKEAVAAFLKHVLMTKDFEYFHDRIAEGLRQYWSVDS